MLVRIATVLAGSAALALTLPASAYAQDDSLPTCSATVTDHCAQRDGHATTHRTTTHSKSTHKTTHHKAKTHHHSAPHHSKKHHHTTKHHATKHHATHHATHHSGAAHHASSTNTTAGATTTHTVEPKSGTMVKSSTTTHAKK